MKYVIAPRSAIESCGINPLSPTVIDGHSVVNENELKFRYPDKPLEEIVGMVDGIAVSRAAALDFISLRKTLTQIKNTENE